MPSTQTQHSETLPQMNKNLGALHRHPLTLRKGQTLSPSHRLAQKTSSGTPSLELPPRPQAPGSWLPTKRSTLTTAPRRGFPGPAVTALYLRAPLHLLLLWQCQLGFLACSLSPSQSANQTFLSRKKYKNNSYYGLLPRARVFCSSPYHGLQLYVYVIKYMITQSLSRPTTRLYGNHVCLYVTIPSVPGSSSFLKQNRKSYPSSASTSSAVWPVDRICRGSLDHNSSPFFSPPSTTSCPY